MQNEKCKQFVSRCERVNDAAQCTQSMQTMLCLHFEFCILN